MARVYASLRRYISICFFVGIVIALSLLSTIDNHRFLLTNVSLSTYSLEETSFYPHLPIQMYTSNRHRFEQLKNPSKKIILLANTFFGDQTWAMKSFQNQSSFSNFSEFYCSFLSNTCEITTDIRRFADADAVLYHMRDPIDRSEKFTKHRRPSQRFVFTLWEPPTQTPDLKSYDRFFNWTMTYRFDSHVFAPYYFATAYRLKNNHWFEENLSDYRRDEEKVLPYENIPINRKKGTAVALISNCGDTAHQRWQMIEELRKYIDVTVYGKCGQPCPSAVDCRTYAAENYYFLLAFENSFCQDYVTEKFFSTITLPIVPVVYGRIDYTRLIPSSGFIDAHNYSSLAALADDLQQIRKNQTSYQSYFSWKKDFVWGGFSTYMSSFCDLCLRMHLDSSVSVLENAHSWWYDQTCQ